MKKEYTLYTDLEVWKYARKLASNVYQLTHKFPDREKFGLSNQLRRAAISISSNIAEGCGRISFKDCTRFLYVARGSLYEIESQLYVALDLNYLNKKEFEALHTDIITTKKLLNGFIKYFKSRTPTKN